MEKKNKKFRLPLRAWLLYLVLVAFLSTGVTLSKYVTSTQGGDGARIIKFDDISISETGDFTDGKFRIQPGINLTKKAELVFEGSEANTYIFVEVSAESFTAMNDNYSFYAIDDKKIFWSVDKTKWTYLTSENGKYIYFKALTANTSLKDTIITDNTVYVSNQLKNSEIQEITNLSASFRGIAVQANGFPTAEDAWEAIK
ncbi:MAG: hypothetical protein IKV85_03210 [Ruminococcus sp.]|nr:hypothetical protein [Ruminococcus sp.]